MTGAIKASVCVWRCLHSWGVAVEISGEGKKKKKSVMCIMVSCQEMRGSGR